MSSTEVWKSWEGRVVEGKFTLRELLGGSDHSAVFLTELPGQPAQKAALKLIPADAGDGDRQLARWRSAASLGHPHLIRIFESGSCGQTLLYIVMELAEDDLAKVLPQRPLDAGEAKDLLPPLLDALSYIHAKGFVHGRIKPSNILAVGDELKLSSDQVAIPAEMNANHRRRDAYDAPETAAGIVTPAGDLWSLGVTLTAAFTQKVAFVDSTQGDPTLPTTIPEPFRAIARECLHLDPNKRGSIAEIKSRLQPGKPQPPAAPAPVPAPAPKHASVADEAEPAARPGTMRWLVAAGLIVLAILVGVGIQHFRGSSEPTAPAASTAQPSSSEPSGSQPTASQTASQPAAGAPSAKTEPSAAPASEPPKNAASSTGAVVHQVVPDVSKSARNTITGTIKVAVRVQVDPSGKVASAKLTNPGPSKYFAREALQAAERWQFSAPEVDGQPTESAWVLQFRFRRGGTQVVPERVKH